MASAGQYIIDKLKTVDNCQSSCNCCKSLQSQINQLKAEIKAIPRINQQEVIEKTEASLTPKLPNLITPFLPNLITPFLNIQLNPIKNFQAKQLADQKQLLGKIANNEKATKAAAELAKRAEIKQLTKNREFLTKILNNQKATRIAANTAKVAEVKQAVKNKELLSRIFKAESAARTATGAAASAGKKAGSALAKIATIVVQLAGFGVAVGTLKLVEHRFNQQDRENQALSRDLSKSLGLINQNRALIKQNDADIDNNKRRIADVSDSAYSAQKQATKAREIGEQAGLSANKANQKSDKNSRLVEGLDASLKGFIFRMNPLIPAILNNEKIAREARKKANEALKAAKSANGKANQANQKAGNTLTQIKEIEKINKNPNGSNNVNNSKLDQLLRQTNNNSSKLNKLIGLTAPIVPALGKIDNKLGTVEKKIGGIDNSVKNLPNSTTFKKSVGDATCKTLNTDSCTSRLREDIKRHDTANGNILLKRLGGKIDGLVNGFNAGANTLQLALLETINKKMGVQLPGGLSGTFGRLWSVFQVDRALNILNFLTSLHNATMLSTNVIQTLTSVIDSAADLVGFKIKNEKDEEISASGFLSKILNDALSKVFGAANIEEFKLKLAAANRIYQAATNMLDDINSMFDSGRQLAELGTNNTGKIGNALKKAGVIFEDAFDWMSEKNNAASTKQRKWDNILNGINGIDDKLSTFNSVIQEVKTAQDSINDLKESRENFNKVLTEDISAISDSADETKKQSSAQTNITLEDTEKAENVEESP